MKYVLHRCIPPAAEQIPRMFGCIDTGGQVYYVRRPPARGSILPRACGLTLTHSHASTASSIFLSAATPSLVIVGSLSDAAYSANLSFCRSLAMRSGRVSME